MPRIVLFALLALAACATPFEQCVSNATKDIRVLNRLITVTQGNLTRGYAIEERPTLENENQVCGEIDGEPVYCEVAVAGTKKVPVAIDLVAEAAKLDSLLARRAKMSSYAEKVVAQCGALYPES